jgi:N,N'-diacetyllegionaminate synthase
MGDGLLGENRLSRKGEMEIWGNKISGSNAVCIIAEIGINHNGDIELAKNLIDSAAGAGVDAVKFQTLNARRYISRFAPKAKYQLKTTEKEESQVEMVSKYELSKEQHIELMKYSQQRGLPFFSTAFDRGGVDLLSELDVECFKIPSGEINNLPLIEHIATKGKPIILSTGMSSLGEVERAVDLIKDQGVQDIALLHCVSNYPASPEDSNLRAMDTMRKAFELPVGYSDHTPGIEIAVAAVALGACMIEKHFTLDRALPGPDHQASLVPEELQALVRAIRNVEKSLGNGVKRSMPSEENTKDVARKSLVAAYPLESGTIVNEDMIAIKRPGKGISPPELKYLVGRELKRDVMEDELFSWEILR